MDINFQVLPHVRVDTGKHNAPDLARKYVGVAFAPFAKDMTTYFCRSVSVC
jgi:hypothetical protein